MAKSNNAEGGSNGTTVTTGNSGGASGDAAAAVTIGAGGALTFDNAHAFGSLAYKFASATSQVAQLRWDDTLVTDHWGRFYIYATASPGNSLAIVIFQNAGTNQARVRLSSAGQLVILDRSSVARGTMGTALTLNAWNRVEWHLINNGTTGSMVLNLYAGDSTTLVDTVTASSIDTGTGTDQTLVGLQAVASANTIWLDDISLYAAAAIGPARTDRRHSSFANWF